MALGGVTTRWEGASHNREDTTGMTTAAGPQTPGSETREEKSTREVDALRQSNDDRRAEKLAKEVTRAHEWRVQVWAQSEIRIRRRNAELVAMGREPIEPFDPDFGSLEMLTHYAEMTLTR